MGSAVVLVVAIVLMNLVTAVIVDNALQQTSNDKGLHREKHQKEKHQKLWAMKHMMDGDGIDDDDDNPTMDYAALTKVPKETGLELCNLVGVDKAIDIFRKLDIDPNKKI